MWETRISDKIYIRDEVSARECQKITRILHQMQSANKKETCTFRMVYVTAAILVVP